MASCRKRKGSPEGSWTAWWPSKRFRTAPEHPAPQLFADSAEHNFPCRRGDEVVSERCRFILLEGLGSGAFGQVTRCSATFRRSNENSPRVQVALKILKHKDFCAEVSVEAEEEARILGQLQHPHIVQMLDFFEFHGHFCIAFELLGRNLYELITEQQGLLPVRLVYEATRQVLSALEYLKKREVIHGDLKPENVLVVDSEVLPGLPEKTPHFKVIDFGGARRVGEADEIVLQTLPYRAPEVLLGLPAVSCSADIWSLGCICIELFVGESLFSHSWDKDAILEGMVQLIGEIPPWMLEEGTRTNEFFDRVKQRPTPRRNSSTDTTSAATGLRRLFQWAMTWRESWSRPLRRLGTKEVETYKLRRRSTSATRVAKSLMGDFRQRRYDVVYRRFGVPRRLVGKPLQLQQQLRRKLEKLIRRMLVLDPKLRIDASGSLRMIS